MKTLVTEGGGTYGQLDFVTAAATNDGSVLLAYVPSRTAHSSSITVDMTALKGFARAQWFDPTSGNYLEIPGSPFPTSERRASNPRGKTQQAQETGYSFFRSLERPA